MATVFDIDLESGSLTGGDEFTGAVTNGGYLTCATAAKYSGTYGMKMEYIDADPIYGWKSITSTKRLRVRYYVNFENYVIQDFFAQTFAVFFSSTVSVCRIRLYRNGSNYYIQHLYRDDTPTEQQSSNYLVSGLHTGWHYIEHDFKCSSSAGANDGFSKIYCDGNTVNEWTGLDNDTHTNAYFYLGAAWGFNSGDSGYVYFDNLIGNDDGSAIGPLSEGTTLNVSIDPNSSWKDGLRVV